MEMMIVGVAKPVLVRDLVRWIYADSCCPRGAGMLGAASNSPTGIEDQQPISFDLSSAPSDLANSPSYCAAGAGCALCAATGPEEKNRNPNEISKVDFNILSAPAAL
jgi:hypothetical protein